ncbi:MAG: hypothetical protein PVJ03_04745 [Chromatiaceae bacterium]
MRQKTVTFMCDAAAAQQLAMMVRAYVDAAYPRGGSECAQAAREALEDAAARCERHPGGQLTLRKRLLPQLRAALRWFAGEQRPSRVASAAVLESILNHHNQSA